LKALAGTDFVALIRAVVYVHVRGPPEAASLLISPDIAAANGMVGLFSSQVSAISGPLILLESVNFNVTR
jgi:hypothetical protein